MIEILNNNTKIIVYFPIYNNTVIVVYLSTFSEKKIGNVIILFNKLLL